jgi:hypothetical protein
MMKQFSIPQFLIKKNRTKTFEKNTAAISVEA